MMSPISAPSSSSEPGPAPSKRFARRLARTVRKQATVTTEALQSAEKDVEVPCDVQDDTCDAGTQTVLTGTSIDAMKEELQNVRTENIILKEKHSSYEEKSFKDKDKKVLFFTGISSYKVLMCMFSFLSPYFPMKKTLGKFQIILLTLICLRLNVSTTFPAYLFSISLPTASRIFTDVIDVMYIRMKPLMKWPGREELQITMPKQFR